MGLKPAENPEVPVDAVAAFHRSIIPLLPLPAQ